MLRATVYVVTAEGVPRDRVVRALALSSHLEFQQRVEQDMRDNREVRDGERVEFGPIAEPWGIR